MRILVLLVILGSLLTRSDEPETAAAALPGCVEAPGDGSIGAAVEQEPGELADAERLELGPGRRWRYACGRDD
ncbi:MAG: hypothetical protein KAI24_02225 [Planctomycetes bacterium]|nr:hypothetical protein [Planctomycetota bacterium]